MAYVSVAEFKQYQGISEATDDALIQALIAGAQADIESHYGIEFEATEDTRYYEHDAVDGLSLTLGKWLLSITTLTNGDSDATVIPDTEYFLIDRSGPPYYEIRLKANSTYSWELDTDYWISVLGEWGWSETADANIKLACNRYTAYLYHQKDSGVYDVTTFPEQGMIIVPKGGMPGDVKSLLDPYRWRAG